MTFFLSHNYFMHKAIQILLAMCLVASLSADNETYFSDGASRQFYEKVAPEIAIWQTPNWLWDNDNGGGPGSGTWQTNYVKCWMQELGVKRQFRNTDDIVLE